MSEKQDYDLAVIKKTQDILGKYVKRPPLTEKLLGKPPFRFLQDIINSIIKETGYLNGLYDKIELSSEGITDRNTKIAFLQKLIDVLKIISNENISARPSKIVAGHEPMKTNELLQILGNCIDKNLDFKPAIQKIISNTQNNDPKKNVKSVTVKEVKNNKSEEQKQNNKTKVINKDNGINKDKKLKPSNSKHTTNKEKIKNSSIPTKKNLKEKEKLKKETKSLLSEKVIADKNEEKTLSKKTNELEKVKENTTEIKTENTQINAVIQGETETKIKDVKDENDQLVKLSDHIEETPTPVIDDKKKINLFSDEIKDKKSNDLTEKRKSSAKSQLKKKSSDEISSNNENVDSNNEANFEDTIKHNKLKENRKSSGKIQSNSIQNDYITTTTDENNSNSQINDSINLQNKSVHEKFKSEIKTNTNNSSKQNIKSENSQSDAPPVKRQSTFTREESKDSNGRPRTSLRPPSVRPPSARPGAPRRRDKNIEIVLQPNDQIKVAGIQLKVESFHVELEDDGENLVIIENENSNEMIEENNIKLKSDDIKLDENAQQGHLVQQILETQKELVQNQEQKETKDEDLDIVSIQNRQNSAKQMNSLRDVIQNLTRSVNPLGKLMDFIPEHMDAMQLEMNMWHDLYSQTFIELKKEKSLTESAIEPMKNQLEQINGTIKEYIEMIDESRAKILKNSEKIFHLFTD